VKKRARRARIAGAKTKKPVFAGQTRTPPFFGFRAGGQQWT